MKICFVGHTFHERTKSSAFMVEMLQKLGALDLFQSSPDLPEHVDNGLVRDLVHGRYDVYVYWQTEYIAAKVMPFVGGRSVIAPMYDGASQRPDEFWRQFGGAQFISFSRRLHETLQRLHLNTAYFQYASAVRPDAKERVLGTVRTGFFWHRRPDSKLNLAFVMKLCERLAIRRLHVREASDHPGQSTRARNLTVHHPGIEIVTSSWSQAHDDHVEASAAPLFYFAPRLQEGIGLAFLEAFARGQIVVAANDSTMNEYLRDGVDGLLYDPDDLSSLRVPDDERIAALSRQALRRARALMDDWNEDQERLRSHVVGDEQRWATSTTSANFMNAVRDAADGRIGAALAGLVERREV